MLNLEIITPKKVMLNTQVKQVTLPGEAGEMGVLPGHLQLLTSLKSGVLQYKLEGKDHYMAVHYGFAQVNKNQVTVLANEAERAEDLDLETAQTEVDALRVKLGKAPALSAESTDLTKQLLQAETRLATANALQA